MTPRSAVSSTSLSIMPGVAIRVAHTHVVSPRLDAPLSDLEFHVGHAPRTFTDPAVFMASTIDCDPADPDLTEMPGISRAGTSTRQSTASSSLRSTGRTAIRSPARNSATSSRGSIARRPTPPICWHRTCRSFSPVTTTSCRRTSTSTRRGHTRTTLRCSLPRAPPTPSSSHRDGRMRCGTCTRTIPCSPSGAICGIGGLGTPDYVSIISC